MNYRTLLSHTFTTSH